MTEANELLHRCRGLKGIRPAARKLWFGLKSWSNRFMLLVTIAGLLLLWKVSSTIFQQPLAAMALLYSSASAYYFAMTADETYFKT